MAYISGLFIEIMSFKCYNKSDILYNLKNGGMSIMEVYLNHSSILFEETVNLEIYIDKTGLNNTFKIVSIYKTENKHGKNTYN